MRTALATGLTLALALVSSVVGCATFDEHSAEVRDGRASLDAVLSQAPLGEPAWEPIPVLERTGAEIRHLALVGDTLFALDGDDTVHAIDLDAGVHRWVLKLDRTPTRPPVVGAGRVAFLSRNRLTVATLDAGVVTLRRALSFTPSSGVVLAEDTAYAGSWGDGGKLRSFSLADGWNGWFRRTDGAVVSTPVLVGSGAERELVYATEGGEVSAVEPRTSAAEPPRAARWTMHTLGANSADLATDGETIYVASEDHGLYALRRGTGEVRWKWLESGVALLEAPVAVGGVVYQAFDGRVAAIDAQTGRELWRVSGVDRFLTRLGDRVVLSGGPSTVVVVEAASGRELARVTSPLFALVATDPSGGTLVFSDGATLFAAR